MASKLREGVFLQGVTAPDNVGDWKRQATCNEIRNIAEETSWVHLYHIQFGTSYTRERHFQAFVVTPRRDTGTPVPCMRIGILLTMRRRIRSTAPVPLFERTMMVNVGSSK